MDNTDTDSDSDCAECSDYSNNITEMRCSPAQCNKYYCNKDIAKATDCCCQQEWVCPECSAPQATGEDNAAPAQAVSNDTQACEKPPEVVKLISEIRRLSRGLMSIKNKLREATMSITRCHERLDVLESPESEAESRIKTLEKRNREIELLKYTVKELRKELNTQNQSCVLNNIEASLDTTMKIFCALHIMQQNKK